MKTALTNRVLLLFIILSSSFFITSFSEKKGGYLLTVKINGIKDTVCYLSRYYGEKQYYFDTSHTDANGKCIFEGTDTLEGGIYSVIIPGNKYFEFIFTEPKFTLETDTLNFIEHMNTSGSRENEVFFSWLKYVNTQHRLITPLRNVLQSVKEKHDSSKILKDQISKIDNEVKMFQEKLIKENPDLFVVKVFKTSADIEVPEAPIMENGKKDSLFAFRYYKEHFFDNVDFSDDRLIRTPILYNKVSQYMKNLTVPDPDSIKISCDYIIAKSRANKEVFKYVVSYFLNEYANSKYMGMDAVYVHLAEKHYITGEAFWTDSTTSYKIKERALALKPTLIGKIAPNIILKDVYEEYKALHDVKAKFTILYFWDPDCGHCKKSTPKLIELYNRIHIEKNVEIYAACSAIEKEKWNTYIAENKLNWINVGDFEMHNPFRSIYDINSTPKIFLLNEQKKIIAKQLDIEQLEDFIDRMISDKKGVVKQIEMMKEEK